MVKLKSYRVPELSPGLQTYYRRYAPSSQDCLLMFCHIVPDHRGLTGCPGIVYRVPLYLSVDIDTVRYVSPYAVLIRYPYNDLCSQTAPLTVYSNMNVCYKAVNKYVPVTVSGSAPSPVPCPYVPGSLLISSHHLIKE